jgi:hypothetical protein
VTLPTAAPDWVPVDRRWLGLDKRTLKPAFFVLAVVIVFVGVVPAINNAISWTNQTTAGDVINMGDGLTFAPPVGWDLTDGFKTTDHPDHGVSATSSSAVLSNGAVQIAAKGGSYSGTADALVNQLNRNLTRNQGSAFKVDGTAVSITTEAGTTGVTEVFRSEAKEGQLAAFTFGKGDGLPTDIGLSFTVTGPAGSLARYRAEIDDMLKSVARKAAS